MNLPAQETATEFADLICADQQWLREEFDALIAASFNRPPAPPPRAPGWVPPCHGFGYPLSGAGAGHRPGRTVWPGGDGRSRQRSPPV